MQGRLGRAQKAADMAVVALGVVCAISGTAASILAIINQAG